MNGLVWTGEKRNRPTIHTVPIRCATTTGGINRKPSRTSGRNAANCQLTKSTRWCSAVGYLLRRRGETPPNLVPDLLGDEAMAGGIHVSNTQRRRWESTKDFTDSPAGQHLSSRRDAMDAQLGACGKEVRLFGIGLRSAGRADGRRVDQRQRRAKRLSQGAHFRARHPCELSRRRRRTTLLCTTRKMSPNEARCPLCDVLKALTGKRHEARPSR